MNTPKAALVALILAIAPAHPVAGVMAQSSQSISVPGKATGQGGITGQNLGQRLGNRSSPNFGTGSGNRANSRINNGFAIAGGIAAVLGVIILTDTKRSNKNVPSTSG